MTADLPATLESLNAGGINHIGQYITFHIDNELYGVNILCIEEIITPRRFTHIPRTPAYFLGIINLRGEVISIIDIRKRFGKEPLKGDNPQSRIVVISVKGLKLGLLVDAIESIIKVESAQVQHSNKIISGDKQQYIDGTVKISDDQILLLLAHDKIIEEEDFNVHIEIPTGAGEVLKEEGAAEEVSPELFLVGFTIGNENFALESLMVEEIIVRPEVTPIPEMTKHMEGIFHLRESAIPLIRLGDKLNIKDQNRTEKSPVIIINVFDVKVGLVVDNITEVYLVKENEVVDPPITLNTEQLEQLKGVIKLERDNKQQLIMLLELEKLFSADEQETLKEVDEQNTKIVEEENKEIEEPILEFSLNGEIYAIPVSLSNEIILLREIVPVPKSPTYIYGVINLRGEVISIVNLPLLVGNKKYEFTQHTRILIVDPGGEKAGLIVEKVEGIRKVYMSGFQKPSSLLTRRGNVFIKGMTQDDEVGGIVVLMDLQKTLEQSQSEEVEEIPEDGIYDIQEELRKLDLEEASLFGARK
ncbi:MAG: chemotaxis protein CheW [SAR324 cluster bacterium]|nr:chemotaxis protein CheW [SAR324 cluster bacterium]